MNRRPRFDLIVLILLLGGIAVWFSLSQVEADRASDEISKVQTKKDKPKRPAPSAITRSNMKVCSHSTYDDSFDRYLSLPEGSAERLFLRANAYVSRGQYERGLEDYVRAIAKDPTDERIYSHMASCYAELDDYAGAMEAVNEAIRLEPKLYMAYGDRSWYQHKLGNESESASDWSVYSSIQPKKYFEYNSLASELFLRERYEEALEAAETSLSLDPESGAFGIKGRVLAEQGKTEEALLWLTMGQERHPNSAYYYKHRAKLLEEHGRGEEAEQDRARLESLKREVLQ